jgi:hypothetical protein
MVLHKVVAHLTNRPLIWAVPLTVAIALGGTADMIFDEDARRLYETNGDIVAIWEQAEQASPASLLDWWTGVWIEPTSPYYRPLCSALFYLEYLAFGRQWRPFCLVTWLMHGGACVLILFFLARLWSGLSAAGRMVPGVLATALFSIPCETTVDGPHWGNRGIARGIMPYWPSQTDVSCLLLSLASLILFDKWLESSRRKHLAGAIAFFAASLLFKEQSVVLPLLAAVLVAYRGRAAKQIAAVAGGGLGISGLFLAVRHVLVPEAFGPTFKGIRHIAFKFVAYLCEPATDAWLNGHSWITISAAVVAAGVALIVWRPRLVLPAIGLLLLGVFVPPAVMAGNVALPTLPVLGPWLLRTSLIFASVVVAWEARRRAPTLPLLAGVVIVHLPVLHVTGPHYYYWPVAWWSMYDVVVVMAVVGTVKAVIARAGERATEAEEVAAEEHTEDEQSAV